ncbi:MAG TPA: sialidase family protein, partial [Methylomirabilota bacterium]|nr:sialidase family protein [Methylomirabilota bacterium]
MKASFASLTAALATSLSLAATVASEWSGELPLPKVATNSVCGGGVPNNMTVLSSGRAYIVFKETTNGVSRFKLTWTDDHGTNWAAPLPFNPRPSAPPSGLPSIVADTTDRLHCSWASGTSIHYAGLDSASHTFSEYTQITNSGKTIAFQQITADRSNRLHVIWHTGNPESATDTAEVWYAQRPAGTTHFDAPVMLSQDDGLHSAFPTADFTGASGQVLAVAWRDTTASPFVPGSDWNIKFRSSTNGGATWNAEQTLASGTDRQFDPLLIVDRHNRIHVAYHAYPGRPPAPNSNYISLAYSSNAGASWQNAYGSNGFA